MRKKTRRGNKTPRYIQNQQNFKKGINSQIPFNKLYISINLITILNNVIETSNDIIANALVQNTKNPISNNTNWLNITKSPDYISYALIDKITNNESAWKQSNRHPVQIRKLIRKIYKKKFSNRQIRSFIGKFKTSYVIYTTKEKKNKENVRHDFGKNELPKIIEKTKNNELKWKIVKVNFYYSKCYAKIFITEKKHVLIDLYYTEEKVDIKSNTVITFHLVDDKNKIFMNSIMSKDSNSVDDLLNIIRFPQHVEKNPLMGALYLRK